MTESINAPDAGVVHSADVRGVHVLKLNQPKAFNVLGEAVLTELQCQLDRIAADSNARVYG